MLLKIINNERQSLGVLLGAWLVGQFISFIHFGVSTPVDSGFYMNSADLIHEGVWPRGQDFMYVAYILLLALLRFLGADLTNVIFIQVLASALAVYSIYGIVKHISSDNLAAFMAGLFYVFWFEFHQWNLIVYTDSLFANVAVITVFLLLKSRSKAQYLLVLMLVVFTTLLRPMGAGFLLAILSYLLFTGLAKTAVSRGYKMMLSGLFIVIGLILVNSLLGEVIASFMQSYARAEIIYPGVTLGLTPPEHLYLPAGEWPPLIRLMAVLLGNPLYMLKITLCKGLLFIGHIKPYYSWLHNLFIAGYLLPLYVLAVKGYKHLPKDGFRLFILVFVVFQVLAVSLTSENWDGRFLLPVLPWVFIPAALGLTAWLKNTGKLNLKHQP